MITIIVGESVAVVVSYSSYIVNVTMVSGSKEDGWDLERDMEWQKATNKRKNKKNTGSETETDDSVKRVRGHDNVTSANEMHFKVIVTFEDNFHLISVAKAIEKEVGKVKFAKYLNNKQILIHTINKAQLEKILKMKTIDRKNIVTQVPGSKARLRGVILEVPLSISMDEMFGAT